MHHLTQANYSFSGALRPLSKLIISIVMLRGRHRALPVAIDRAVMLPSEWKANETTPVDETAVEDSDGPNGVMEDHELQQVQPRDLHPLPESVSGEEKAADESIPNGFSSVTFAETDKDKLREDENHERTSFVLTDSPLFFTSSIPEPSSRRHSSEV